MIRGYGVIAEKPRVGKLGQIFPCTPYEMRWIYTIRWIKKFMTPFSMASTSCITIQSLGKIA